MRINTITNNTTFGKVYAISGTKEQLASLKRITKESQGFVEAYDATTLYKKDRKRGVCKTAVEEGKDVMIFVTGKDDTDKIHYDDPDWNTLKKLEKHISQIFSLKSIFEERDQFATAISNLKIQKEILREMLK